MRTRNSGKVSCNSHTKDNANTNPKKRNRNKSTTAATTAAIPPHDNQSDIVPMDITENDEYNYDIINNNNNNSSGEDSDGRSYLNSDSEDDWVKGPRHSTQIRAEVAQMAKSAGDLSDVDKPKGPGKAKIPYYRMTQQQKMQHRRARHCKQRQDEDDNHYSSLFLTPQEMVLRKESSKKVMDDYLADWKVFLEERKTCAQMRRDRRTKVGWKKNQVVKGNGNVNDFSFQLPPGPDVKPRPTEAQYVKHMRGWKVAYAYSCGIPSNCISVTILPSLNHPPFYYSLGLL